MSAEPTGADKPKRVTATYQQIGDDGRVIGTIMLRHAPAPGSDFDLKVGEEGPFSDAGYIRRIR